MIVRGPRPEGNFYVLDKSISEDRRLSWGARGMLVFLLGKPDHWQVSPAALVSEVSASAKPSGRDSTYALIGELIEAGYIRREQSRSADGTLGPARYVVSERPLTEKPEAAPHPALPYTAEPYPANPTLAKTDSKQELKKSKNGKSAAALSCPSDVDAKVWSDFVALRKAKRAPLTETALDLIHSEARKAGLTLEDALRTCCARGWQGFRAEWVGSSGSATSRGAVAGRPPIHPSFYDAPDSSGVIIDVPATTIG